MTRRKPEAGGAGRKMTMKEARGEATRRWFRMQGQDGRQLARFGFASLLRKDKPKRYEVGLRSGQTVLSCRGDSWEEAFAGMERLERDVIKAGGRWP